MKPFAISQLKSLEWRIGDVDFNTDIITKSTIPSPNRINPNHRTKIRNPMPSIRPETFTGIAATKSRFGY
jgi:hypothetical protein